MYSNIRNRSLLLTTRACTRHPTAGNTSTTPTATSPSFLSFSTTTTTPSSQKKEKQTLQSYKDQKQARKEYRTQLYNYKINRKTNILPNRRTKDKNYKRNLFHQWFDKKTKNELYYNRQAKRNNQQWKMKVGIMIERLPVVTEEKEDWELEYMYMKAEYDSERSIVYPKEIVGFDNDGSEERKVLTIDEIYDLFPEGYKPAPRITEADKNNIIQTLDRKLTKRVYLALRPNDQTGWMLPTIDLNTNNDNETFTDCVKKYLSSNAMTQDLDIIYMSNCPMAVEAIPYDQNTDSDSARSENGTYFGEKIFYMRVQYLDGSINEGKVDKKTMDDWGWLDRSEMVERVKAEKGEDASLFYHYML